MTASKQGYFGGTMPAEGPYDGSVWEITCIVGYVFPDRELVKPINCSERTWSPMAPPCVRMF